MPTAIEAQYQTFWPRFWSGWIDTAIFLPLAFLDYLLDQHLHSPVVLAFWFVLYSSCFEIYSVAMHARYGQTLGKMAMGIKVLDVSGGKLVLRQALLRDCVPILLSLMAIFEDLPKVLAGISLFDNPELGTWTVLGMYGSFLWFGAELVTMLTNAKRRALHDFIAGSVVVRTGSPGVPVERDATVG